MVKHPARNGNMVGSIPAFGSSKSGDAIITIPGLNTKQLILDAPKGLEQKYSTYVWLGEPGYRYYPEVHYVGEPNTRKTSAMADSALITALHYPESRSVIARDTRENLLKSTIETIKSRFKLAFDAGVCQHITSRNTIEFYNGSVIYLFGLDAPTAMDDLLGVEPFRAFLDQLEGLEEEILNTLLTRLARHRPKHHSTGEPGNAFVKTTANFQRGRNWIWRRGEVEAHEIAPDFFETEITGTVFGREVNAKRLLIKVRTQEVDFGDNDQYSTMVLLAGGAKNRFFTGDWAESTGLLFPEYKPQVHETEDFDGFHGSIGYGGIDHGLGGTAHPSVGVFGAVTTDQQLVIAREYVSTQTQSAKQSAMAMAQKMAELHELGVPAFYLRGDASMWRRDPRQEGSIATDYEEVFSELDFPVYLSPASKKRDTGGSVIKGLEGMTGLNRMKELLAGRIGYRDEKPTPRVLIARRHCPQTVRMFGEATVEAILGDVVPITDVFDAARYFMGAVPFGSRNRDEDPHKNPNKGRKQVIYR